MFLPEEVTINLKSNTENLKSNPEKKKIKKSNPKTLLCSKKLKSSFKQKNFFSIVCSMQIFCWL